MESNIKKIVELAKLKLIRNQLSFFGMIAARFIWKIYDFGKEQDGIEGRVFLPNDPKDPFNEVLDHSIHLNKTFIGKEDYTYLNLVDLILHEILHVIHKHGVRRGGNDHQLWNIAGDHVIDRFLRDLNLTKPYHQWNIIPDLDKACPNCTTEEAYEWLNKNVKRITITVNGNGTFTVTDQHGNSFTINENCGGRDSDGSSQDQQQIKQEIERIIADARAYYENQKDRGNIPGHLATILEELLKVEIPWQELLKIAIKTNVIMKPEGYGWKSPNKRLRAHNLLIPGTILEETNDGVGTLIVHVDTSGSVGDEQLKEAAGIIVDSMRYFKTIKLITADVQIHQEVDFHQDNINDFLSYIKKEGFKGRGGTSHGPTFKRIDEIYDENHEDLSMVISITDGYSDVEHIYNTFEFIRKEVPLVFLISQGKLMDLDQDVGSIKQILIEK